MQKIILSSLLFFFTINYVFSQSFILSDEINATVTSGATININGDTGTIITKKLRITNNTSTNKIIKVKKIIVDTITGSENDFCFGGECQLPSIYLSTESVDLSAGQTDSSFEGGYRPHSLTGTSIIRYIFFDVNNTNDSVYINIAYTANIPSGIKDNILKQVEFPVVYPNPAHNYANFSWSLASNFNSSRIIIRNLVGSVVKEKIISTQSGKTSIDINDLQNGVYFYSLLINETPYITRKMIIK